MLKIKDKEKITILNALKAGVVPSVGLKYMQVGRAREIAQLVKDLEHIETGGTIVRFVVGDFGAGKSFLLTLCKLMAHEKKMIVINADITTERILCASDGKAKSLLTELIKNMSSKTRPEGNALKLVVETWIGKFTADLSNPTKNDFHKALQPISHLALSSDFAQVLFKYLTAYQANDEATLEKCLKWMRAEYETKTDAKNDLGVSAIVEDSDFYDMLKILSVFSKLAGFSGLLINIDEIAVLIRQRGPLRNKNYETLLTIINDCHQGSVEGIGFLFGATTEAIENKEKGLYSYGALQTRLSNNPYASSENRDLSGPVMKLLTLSKEEMFVLIHKLRDIQASFNPENHIIDEDGLMAFFNQTFSRIGSEEHMSPRDIIKDFLSLISVLESNPDSTWRDYIKQTSSIQNTTQESGLVRLRAK